MMGREEAVRDEQKVETARRLWRQRLGPPAEQ